MDEDGHRVQVERQLREGKKLDSLWIYVMMRRQEVREITWWFTQDIWDQKISKEK